MRRAMSGSFPLCSSRWYRRPSVSQATRSSLLIREFSYRSASDTIRVGGEGKGSRPQISTWCPGVDCILPPKFAKVHFTLGSQPVRHAWWEMEWLPHAAACLRDETQSLRESVASFPRASPRPLYNRVGQERVRCSQLRFVQRTPCTCSFQPCLLQYRCVFGSKS